MRYYESSMRIIQNKNHILNSRLLLLLSIAVAAAIVTQFMPAQAACSAPATDYGTDTMTMNVPASGTYKVWSSMLAPDSTNDSYLLEIDGGSCYTVGDTGLPVGSWKWVDYQNGNVTSKITVNLSAGNHTFKAIGREPGVSLDKIMITTDLTCTPTDVAGTCTTAGPPYDNKVIVASTGAAYYVEGGRRHPISTPAVRDCIMTRRGTGNWFTVPDAVVGQYTGSSNGYCNYEQELGLNFVQEQGDPTVWLVKPNGVKQHVGSLCVVDPYTTVLKQFRIFTVPASETSGHTVGADFFGTPSVCATLPH